MKQSSPLFVYGSLGPNRPNAHILESVGGSWIKATVKGYLKNRGWGAQLGYPALVLDSEGEDIDGLVFQSENLPEHWDQLDEFEGDEYKRILSPVKLEDGSTIEAYLYVLNTEVGLDPGGRQVSSGRSVGRRGNRL